MCHWYNPRLPHLLMSQSDLLVISSSRGVLETLVCRTDLDSPGDRRYWLVSCPLDVGSLTGCNHTHFIICMENNSSIYATHKYLFIGETACCNVPWNCRWQELLYNCTALSSHAVPCQCYVQQFKFACTSYLYNRVQIIMHQEQLSVTEKSGFIKTVVFATVHHCYTNVSCL